LGPTSKDMLRTVIKVKSMTDQAYGIYYPSISEKGVRIVFQKTYWGDIHNHCGISYGYGGLENALKAAKGQLDFCQVTGHAMYPDMLEGIKEIEYGTRYHKEGFKKFKDSWERVRETIAEANSEKDFITFQGYEIHSRLLGDYHIISPEDDLPLIEAETHIDLVEKLAPRRAIAVPHHTAYTPTRRGISWNCFHEEISPIVEVYSKHGCGMSDHAPYPYLHEMGPRDSRNTIYSGLKRGKRFGFSGSTDHHAGYPGSYGDGRIAVRADKKTRESIWEALLARRTYAVTGDKIECDFRVNTHPMGSIIPNTERRIIGLSVKGADLIDTIWIYKNCIPWKTISSQDIAENNYPSVEKNDDGRYIFRVEMGWGQTREGFNWNGRIKIRDGKILSAEPCFRGRNILHPSPDIVENDKLNNLDNRIEHVSNSELSWYCTTFKNPSTLNPQTDAVILELEGDYSTVVKIDVNNIRYEASIEELLEGSRSFHVKEWSSEALLIHPALPESGYSIKAEWEDLLGVSTTGDKVIDEKVSGLSDYGGGCSSDQSDFYHVEVRQQNNQWAWLSPVFVRK
jgi:hypothetical protein